MSNETADFTHHHIEGYARAAVDRGIDAHFKVPLISHIEGNLYVGGCRDGLWLGDEFRTVVSLYKWERFRLGSGVTRMEVEMYDDGGYIDEQQVDELARYVVHALTFGKVLVHCQAGLNRSNLIATAALVKSGYDVQRAIALLRAKRCQLVLCNQSFEHWLLENL